MLHTDCHTIYVLVHVCISLTTACVREAAMEGRKRRLYDITFKLDAVKCAETSSKKAAARPFHVDQKGFVNGASKMKGAWVCGEERRIKAKAAGWRRMKTFGLRHGGRAVGMGDGCALLNLRTSHRMISDKPKEMAYSTDFCASTGWLQHFMARKNLSLR